MLYTGERTGMHITNATPVYNEVLNCKIHVDIVDNVHAGCSAVNGLFLLLVNAVL